MASNHPIGVFDSGVGGLTAVKELRALLPHEDIVYFGDTSRAPYGNRSRDTILRYARQDVNFLLSQKVKMIIAACGTVSSVAASMGQSLPVPFTGVVTPTCRAAVKATKNKKIGVIATAATIDSGSYRKELNALHPEIQVFEQPCPLFVPLVENAFIAPGDQVTNLVAQRYLSGLRGAGVDTLILGCTHYPIISAIISKAMGDQVTLIDSGRETAVYAARLLKDQQLLASGCQEGRNAFYVSDSVDGFNQIADIFLGREMNHSACRINIEEY